MGSGRVDGPAMVPGSWQHRRSVQASRPSRMRSAGSTRDAPVYIGARGSIATVIALTTPLRSHGPTSFWSAPTITCLRALPNCSWIRAGCSMSPRTTPLGSSTRGAMARAGHFPDAARLRAWNGACASFDRCRLRRGLRGDRPPSRRAWTSHCIRSLPTRPMCGHAAFSAPADGGSPSRPRTSAPCGDGVGPRQRIGTRCSSRPTRASCSTCGASTDESSLLASCPAPPDAASPHILGRRGRRRDRDALPAGRVLALVRRHGRHRPPPFGRRVRPYPKPRREACERLAA